MIPIISLTLLESSAALYNKDHSNYKEFLLLSQSLYILARLEFDRIFTVNPLLTKDYYPLTPVL